jgi:hypothetical protein
MAVQPCRDVDIAHPIGGVEHDPRALDLTPRSGHLPRTTLKPDALIAIKLDLIATGSGHDLYFNAAQPAPLHNSTNFRTPPLDQQTTCPIEEVPRW